MDNKQKLYFLNIFLLFFIISIIGDNIMAKDNEMQDFVVAKVNNVVITNSEINSRIRYVVKTTKISFSNNFEQKLLRLQVIDKMIEEELIRQDAKKLNITVLDEEINNALQIIASQSKKNVAQFKFFLKENNISLVDFLEYLEAEVLWSKISDENFKSKIKVIDLEIEEFFEQAKAKTDNRKFLLAEIVINKSMNINNAENNALEFASKISLDLNNGANFNELVRQFSVAVNSQNNGEIGWVNQGDIDAKIYQAISNLDKNSSSKPILFGDGYHIFKVLDIKLEKRVNDKNVDFARNFIFRRKLQNYGKGYLMEIRKKSFIEIIE
jgi:peptidyl-prolyl cis-trans isomerase SurA